MNNLIAINPAPMSEELIVDPAWLTSALAASLPGVIVRGANIVERLVSNWTKLRLKLDYDGAPTNAPQSICIKALIGDGLRIAGRGSAIEAQYYCQCAPSLSIRSPKPLYTGIDRISGHGILIMEDLIAAGAKFGSALSPYSSSEVRSGLNQIAALHTESARLWTPQNLAWPQPFLERVTAQPIIAPEALHDLLNGPRGDLLPAGVRDGPRLCRAIASLNENFRTRPAVLVHGDAHAGNLYFQDGEVGIVDWQVVHWGHWALDVAYHISAVLTPQERRASERELLQGYLTQLETTGGPRLEFGAAWRDYQMALVYGFYLWGVTRRVDPVITNEFNHRLGLAVVDHDSFGLLGV